MPEKTSPPDSARESAAAKTAAPAGERIAKVLSRRGVASRREAERLIEAGEVSVNGKRISSPALNVTTSDRITVSGKLLPAEEQARLWLYYKPEGLVTSAADEKGRDTVFDHLPEDMPRVMSVGRLDLNSEGLLLLTNDGGLKRRLELPSTGWLRKYRVRVNGRPEDQAFQPLRDGITIEGETFKPMQVTLDRQQGANAWLTVGLREGRNREIRRAMNAIGLYVNRLIRVSYGPFRLGELQPGQVEEVKPRVLRDQLGEIEAEVEAPAAPRKSVALTRLRSPKPDRNPERSPTGAAPGRGTGPASPRSFTTRSTADSGKTGSGKTGTGKTGTGTAGSPERAFRAKPASGQAASRSRDDTPRGQSADGVKSFSRRAPTAAAAPGKPARAGFTTEDRAASGKPSGLKTGAGRAARPGKTNHAPTGYGPTGPAAKGPASKGAGPKAPAGARPASANRAFSGTTSGEGFAGSPPRAVAPKGAKSAAGKPRPARATGTRNAPAPSGARPGPGGPGNRGPRGKG